MIATRSRLPRAGRGSRTLVARRTGPRRGLRSNLSLALSRLDREHAGLLLAVAELESPGADDAGDPMRQTLLLLLREDLRQTQYALQRAARGLYGVCATCNGTITPRLLELSPSTTVCPVCEARAQREHQA